MIFFLCLLFSLPSLFPSFFFLLLFFFFHFLSSLGSSSIEEIEVTEEYKTWTDLVSNLFDGGMNIFTVDALHCQDGQHFIIEVCWNEKREENFISHRNYFYLKGFNKTTKYRSMIQHQDSSQQTKKRICITLHNSALIK